MRFSLPISIEQWNDASQCTELCGLSFRHQNLIMITPQGLATTNTWDPPDQSSSPLRCAKILNMCAPEGGAYAGGLCWNGQVFKATAWGIAS